MDKLAKQQACQLMIEQEIEEGLKAGKKPYSIGKELSQWAEKIFEAVINPRTIEQRARRIEDATNVAKQSQPIETIIFSTPEILENRKPQGGGAREGAGRPHISFNSGEQEWYTPPEYIEAARLAMGSIDCDPASSDIANQTVCATVYYTKQQDGLSQVWNGNVWLNPPYSQPDITQFCKAVVDKVSNKEIKQACILVNNATDTAWFHMLLGVAAAICLVKGRIKFLNTDGTVGAPLQGQIVIYIGENKTAFSKEFTKFGRVMVHE